MWFVIFSNLLRILVPTFNINSYLIYKLQRQWVSVSGWLAAFKLHKPYKRQYYLTALALDNCDCDAVCLL